MVPSSLGGRSNLDADEIPTPGTARLPGGRASKGGRCAKYTIRRFRAVGMAGAMLLLLGLSAWGQGIVGDTGGDLGAQTAGTRRVWEAVVEDAPAAQEGAKKAIGWTVGLNSGDCATILHTTTAARTGSGRGRPGRWAIQGTGGN